MGLGKVCSVHQSQRINSESINLRDVFLVVCLCSTKSLTYK
ncbi:hypothetical protein ANAPH2_00387 [Anaplasma phagocytophilum]|nr:hypothetical protein ANAPH2_00387 [Anaplasma phagocytophilum]